MSDTAEESIRDSIGAALDGLETPQDPPAPTDPPEQIAAPETDPVENTGRARDTQGRFAKQETPTEAAEQPVVPERPKETIPTLAEDVEKATKSWPKADREVIQSLPEDVQRFIVRRHKEMEAHFTRNMQGITELRREYEPVDQLFAPHREEMRKRGLTVNGMVAGWINMEQKIADPVQAPKFIADAIGLYKIDKAAVIRALGGQTDAGQGTEGANPTPAYNPEFAALQARVEAFERQQAEGQYNAAAHSVMSAIQAFASAMDGAGNPLHPHFEAVENDMATLADIHRARGEPIPPLEELYKRAVRSNDAVQETIAAQRSAAEMARRAEAERKAQADRAEKARRARTASSPVAGSGTSTLRTTARTGSLRDTLNEAFDEAEAA